MKVLGHGCGKFPTGELIDSSAKRGWVGLLAERRSHPAGELPTFTPRHGESAGRGLIFNPGFKRLQRNAPLPPQEMNTIEQARRVLDRAFTATIAKIAAVQCNHERASYGAHAQDDQQLHPPSLPGGA